MKTPFHLYRGGGELWAEELKGERDHRFHNKGDGPFIDLTVKADVEDNQPYHGFTAIFIDSNGNGKLELDWAPTRSRTIFTWMPRAKASPARFSSKPRAVESPDRWRRR